MTTRHMAPGELEAMLRSQVAEAREARAQAAQRKRRRALSGTSRPSRRRTRGHFAIGAGIMLTFVAATVYGATINIEVADRKGYAAGITDEGAIVEYIGDEHTTFESAGTGNFDSFVRIQADDDERGYNTDAKMEPDPTEPDSTFDTKGGNFTHSIRVSEIPIVECESIDGSQSSAGLCWELFADLNESDNTPKITLDALEVYFTNTPDLTGYPFTGTATKVFDSDDQIQINDVNQGSGRGDLRYLVPVSGVSIPSNCDYGSTTCATYFVLYSEYGFADGSYDSDGGFEEWKVKSYPFLSVEKTAATTFTRTFAWTIDKSVDPAAWNLFDGDSGTSDWTVAVTKDAGTDSGWAVTGTITIDNPSKQDAIIASVSDVISGVGSVSPNCGVTFPHELEAGDTLVCTYSSPLPDGTARTNTAAATLDTSQVFDDTAAITFGAPSTLVNDTVDVTDTNGQSWDDVADDDSFSYAETFDCAADEGTHDNTATITQTGQSDSASVTVTCYDLDVTKTAVPTFSRDFDWTIEKSVSPASLDLFDGDSDDVSWTVTWTKGAAEDAGYAAAGQITIHNNHPSLEAEITSVSDLIAPAIAATVNCGDGTIPYVIAAGGDLVCTYTSNLPDDATRTNTATAVQQNYDYASDLTATASGTSSHDGSASVDFTDVEPTVTDDTASLGDARPGNTIDGDVVSASGSTSWSETFACGEDEGTHTNTATLTETDTKASDSDDASVTVNCHQLTVTKSAATSFDRDFDWTVAKERVLGDGEVDGDGNLATLTLDPDQTFTLTYEITVDLAGDPGYTDSNWAVAGQITVTNPAPIAAMGVAVSDEISNYGPADSLDCDAVTSGEQTTVDIPADSSVTCAYSSATGDGSNETNTATATLNGIPYTDDAAVDFSAADITEIDECVVVTDDNGTPGDTSDDTELDASLCADEAPETYTHTIDVGPFAACGEYPFTNTAHIVTVDDDNDTGESHDGSFLVTIDVPCPQGCTLTPGYWKTHNELFWGGAPEDDNWFLIDPDGDGTAEGPNEDFFDLQFDGQPASWFEVFWTNPAGRPYYQLTFHYMAAVLNTASIEDQGGSIPGAVQTAIDDAAALLDEYDGSVSADKNPDIKGKNAKSIRAQFVTLAGILGSFNEGTFPGGPMHCDEDGTSSGGIMVPPLLPARRRRAA